VPWAELTEGEREVARLGITWALTEEAAGLDLDLAIEVREAVQDAEWLAGELGEESAGVAWDRAWRAAAQMVMMCARKLEAKRLEGQGEGLDDLPWRKARAEAKAEGAQRSLYDEPLVQEAARLLGAQPVGGRG
jgi:hypothetical protein